MKQFLVVGAGSFGGGIIKELYKQECELVVCDINENYLEDYDEFSTYSVVGDMRDDDVLDEFNIEEFDAVFIAIGTDEYSAILVTKKVKERGAKKIIAKASNKEVGEILESVGADRVVNPEEEAGAKIARHEMMSGVAEYFEITKDVSAIEMAVPEQMLGHTLRQLDFSRNYDLTVSLVLRNGKPLLTHFAEIPFKEGDLFLLIGENKKIEKLKKKFQ
ncbi:TrkA family potassium uptake protein [Peribacillus cavernae]|uniref:TrkA family potassium uptake protein n=1 Tax=Peribacillus cavernae TaxID=1674310 RepID=A0A3S0VXB8_9BACI|nr:TrkA family potassium uptake protein [Peribacillus cavernae]MDQ0217661.1 trk system potassium uptake protein TrkA [Peribacillus cavernae]RUQ28136.1 TrkA family potassium uptake protein [Peribacillus cavernae]